MKYSFINDLIIPALTLYLFSKMMSMNIIHVHLDFSHPISDLNLAFPLREAFQTKKWEILNWVQSGNDPVKVSSLSYSYCHSYS